MVSSACPSLLQLAAVFLGNSVLQQQACFSRSGFLNIRARLLLPVPLETLISLAGESWLLPGFSLCQGRVFSFSDFCSETTAKIITLSLGKKNNIRNPETTWSLWPFSTQVILWISNCDRDPSSRVTQRYGDDSCFLTDRFRVTVTPWQADRELFKNKLNAFS